MLGPENDLERVKRITGLRARWIKVVGGWHGWKAAQARERYVGHLIGITGSAGKTTASHFLAETLKAFGSVKAGIDTNTEYQVLRTVRHVKAPVDYVVQEVSGHEPGHIGRITSKLPFDGAIVTAVGADHWTSFRSLEAIAAEKGILVSTLRPGGFACLNADDPLVAGMAAACPARVVTYGTKVGAEVRAVDIKTAWPGRLSFTLEAGGKRVPVETQLVTSLYLPSVLGVLAAVHALGLDLDKAAAAVASVPAVANRMEVRQGADGHTYLLDTMKGSLWSTRLLIDRVQELAAPNLVVVLGDISDIPNDVSRQYKKMVKSLAGKAQRVIGVGPAASAARKAARDGMTNCIGVETAQEVPALLRGQPPALVLLKSNGRLNLNVIVNAAGEPH